MDRDQLQRICDEVGMKIEIGENLIKEEKGYYENYHQIERDGSVWSYSEVNFDSRPGPEKENITTFGDEKQAIKHFFLKILRRFYSNEIHVPNNPIRNVQTIEEVEMYFRSLGIKEEYYSFRVMSPQAVYAELEGDKMRVSYLDRNTQKKFTTMPLELGRGFFVMYRLTYSLSLLKEVEKEYLQKNVLEEKFDDNDIELFIK